MFIKSKESTSMSPRIVILDDIPLNVELLRDICFEAGFTNVCCYTDPATAIREIKNQGKPDLIITDNNMPGMKGTDVLKVLEEHFGSINALIVTAEPGKVDFIGKEYPILGKEMMFPLKLLEFVKQNLKAD
jgi:CheY-like chemotaxis protein